MLHCDIGLHRTWRDIATMTDEELWDEAKSTFYETTEMMLGLRMNSAGELIARGFRLDREIAHRAKEQAVEGG